jgi:hypothetical protein
LIALRGVFGPKSCSLIFARLLVNPNCKTMVGSIYTLNATWAFQLAACWIGILYILTALILGWAARSWKAALTSALLSILFGVVFHPWSSFDGFHTANPDALFWQSLYQSMATAWAVSASASVMSIPGILWFHARFGPSFLIGRPKSRWSRVFPFVGTSGRMRRNPGTPAPRIIETPALPIPAAEAMGEASEADD